MVAEMIGRREGLACADPRAYLRGITPLGRAVLSRERDRADRTGLPLSLVLVSARDGEGASRAAVLVRDRMRTTDEVVALATARLAVVLPHTPLEGARTFIQGVLDLARSRGLAMEARLYRYDPQATPVTTNADDAVSGFVPVDSVRTSLNESDDDATGGGGDLDGVLTRRMPRWKRAMDIFGAGAVLLLALPVLLVAAAMLRASGPGPVLFRQMRAGRGARPFEMLKLRTMVVDAEAKQAALLDQSEQDGPAFKLRNDPRITPVGRLLRRTSIDELPQLINVLRGEMSLVGPRPLPMAEAADCRNWLSRRMDVTPGLTCFWQVGGRSTVSFAQWARMDIDYTRRLSLVTDLKILVRTVPAVLRQQGAC